MVQEAIRLSMMGMNNGGQGGSDDKDKGDGSNPPAPDLD